MMADRRLDDVANALRAWRARHAKRQRRMNAAALRVRVKKRKRVWSSRGDCSAKPAAVAVTELWHVGIVLILGLAGQLIQLGHLYRTGPLLQF